MTCRFFKYLFKILKQSITYVIQIILNYDKIKNIFIKIKKITKYFVINLHRIKKMFLCLTKSLRVSKVTCALIKQSTMIWINV